jgi:hypothetical protein
MTIAALLPKGTTRINIREVSAILARVLYQNNLANAEQTYQSYVNGGIADYSERLITKHSRDNQSYRTYHAPVSCYIYDYAEVDYIADYLACTDPLYAFHDYEKNLAKNHSIEICYLDAKNPAHKESFIKNIAFEQCWEKIQQDLVDQSSQDGFRLHDEFNIPFPDKTGWANKWHAYISVEDFTEYAARFRVGVELIDSGAEFTSGITIDQALDNESSDDTTEEEKELKQGVREIWEKEGRPEMKAFFPKILRKYINEKGSPITHVYTSGVDAGIAFKTSSGTTGKRKKKTISNWVSEFKRDHSKTCQ